MCFHSVAALAHESDRRKKRFSCDWKWVGCLMEVWVALHSQINCDKRMEFRWLMTTNAVVMHGAMLVKVLQLLFSIMISSICTHCEHHILQTKHTRYMRWPQQCRIIPFSRSRSFFIHFLRKLNENDTNNEMKNKRRRKWAHFYLWSKSHLIILCLNEAEHWIIEAHNSWKAEHCMNNVIFSNDIFSQLSTGTSTRFQI